MASDNLERIWKSIIPLSSLPKTRPDSALNASRLLLPPLTPINTITGTATTRRMQQELTQHRIERLTERVDHVVEAVNQAKDFVLQTDGKLNSLMDKALESTTILVNRSQARILEAMGQPAQDGITKELLEAQKDVLGVVGLMFQQTTSLQANQANIQASLISLMSQTQQISGQMSAMEQRISQKLDGLREPHSLVLEQGHKRLFDLEGIVREGNPKPSKRRKSKGTEWKPSPPRATLVSTKEQPDHTDTMVYSDHAEDCLRNVSSGSALLIGTPPDKLSDEESPESPLTPLDLQDPHIDSKLVESLHGSIEQARALGSTGNLVNGRLTKAQKLASFLGDNGGGDESSMEDLFSGLE